MQNMYYIAQKKMTQQLKNRKRKNNCIESEQAWKYTCNECVLPLMVSHAFLFWKAMAVRDQFICVVFSFPPFLFWFPPPKLQVFSQSLALTGEDQPEPSLLATMWDWREKVRTGSPETQSFYTYSIICPTPNRLKVPHNIPYPKFSN